MNWLDMTDDQVMSIATPIMDNLMDASTEVDHQRHVRDFSERLKAVVTRESLEQQCKQYQEELGVFASRELVGIFKKSKDVRVFWKQWYSKSTNEFVAFLHLAENNGKVEVVNVSVS